MSSTEPKRRVESVVLDHDGWTVKEVGIYPYAPEMGHFWGPMPRIGESVDMVDTCRGRYTVVDVVHTLSRGGSVRTVLVKPKDEQ